MRRLLITLSMCVATIGTGWAQAPVTSEFDGQQSGIIAAGSTIDGWTVVAPTWNAVYALANDYAESSVRFSTHGGSSALDLTGAGNAGLGVGIHRDFATTVGQDYEIEFFLGNATGSADGMQGNSSVYLLPSSLDVMIDGSSIGIFTNADVTNGTVNWRRFTAGFTAQHDYTRVGFFNATPLGDNYAGLDDVALTAVPEPLTWTMLLAGFAMVGYGMRSARPSGIRPATIS